MQHQLLSTLRYLLVKRVHRFDVIVILVHFFPDTCPLRYFGKIFSFSHSHIF